MIGSERAIAVWLYGEPRLDVVDLGGASVTLTQETLQGAYNQSAHIDGGLR